MKKITKILLLLFSFFMTINKVKAIEYNYIYVGEPINNIQVHFNVPGYTKDQYVYELSNRDTKELVYCIEPGVPLKNTQYQVGSGTYSKTSLTKEQWEKIRHFIAFGYKHNNRTDIKWYVATQFLIWDYLLEGKGEVYFIDDNGNPIKMLEEEMKAIEEDVERSYILPSFVNDTINMEPSYEIRIGESLEFTDTNNILDNYYFSTYNKNIIMKDGNKIKVTFNTPGLNYVFAHQETDMETMPEIYFLEDYQTTTNISFATLKNGSVYINVLLPTLTIKKVSSEETNLSLEGAAYKIYSDGGSEFMMETDANGIITLPDLMPDNYHIQEIKAPLGFELNPNILDFTLKSEDLTLTIENKPQHQDVTIIKKYLAKDSSLKLEAYTVFEIYYKDSGNLVGTYTTNNEGEFSVSLAPGNYVLKQKTGKEGYQKIADLGFAVKDKPETIELTNYPITSNLTIEKRDSKTNALIKEPTIFKIFDLETNEYLVINGKQEFTTQNGILKIDNIPYGQYKIIETKASKGYLLNKEGLEFKVTEDKKEIVLSFYNKKITSNLTIEKRDSKTNELIMDPAIFKILNLDTNKYLNIDGIEEFQTMNGTLKLNKIPFGKYKIIEIESPKDYLLNENGSEFEVTEEGKEIIISFYNEPATGTLIISKLDSISNVGLANVTFALYDSENNLINKYITDDNGLIEIDLPIGEYRVKEEIAQDGYELLLDEMKATIKSNIKTTLTVYNRLKIEVPKTNSEALLIGLLSSVAFLIIGIILNRYEEKNHKNK